jgi:cytochrome c-type biogenesis protein CcmH/NrfG
MGQPCPKALAERCSRPSCSIIRAMRAASLALLLVGFGVGFGGMYKYISPRAAEISRPLEQFVPQRASAAPAPPPADPAVVKKLEDQIKADPRNFEALRELGNLRYDERNYVEAAALYEKALAVHPENLDVRSDRGGALLQSQQVDEAIKELQAVLAKDPAHPQALFILGVALIEGKNDRAGAVANWKKLIATHPDLPEREAIERQIQQVEELSRRK